MGAADPDVHGAVHSWDLSTGVDGPGTRFVAFLAGCPLRCLYCHSPDTWTTRSGDWTTVAELMARIEGFQRFIEVAGGGVTLSGGEPLLQPRFTSAVLRRCKDAGLHTALDTSGSLGDRADDDLLTATDLVLLDIKSWDPALYRRLTGGTLPPTLRFARRLAGRGVPMWIRFVVVPGLTDAVSNVDGVARFVAELSTVEKVDVLPYHRLGQRKYAGLGLPFPLPTTAPPDAETMARVCDQFAAQGLRVTGV